MDTRREKMTTKTGRLRTVQHKNKHIMDQRGTERKLKASGSQREESDVRGQFGWLVGCGVLLVLLMQGVFSTVVMEDSSTFDQLNGTYNTVDQDAESARGACQLDSQQVMAPRYIVRFTEYRMQDEWKELVESTIHMEKDLGLKWIERNNAARKYPTDFGVVESVGGDLEPREVLKLLLGTSSANATRDDAGQKVPASLLKDVYRDSTLYNRKIAQAPPERAGTLYIPSSGIEAPHLVKRSGRMQTKLPFELEGSVSKGRNRRLQDDNVLVEKLVAEYLWKKNISGQGIKMGVFDTGIKDDHPDVNNIEERTNWTHEDTLEDGLGHGSFVAGVIAGNNPNCNGLAPDVSIYTFRVFTNDQVSYTSWFLDAFNYAIATEMDVVNLSIGGPDYLDAPFVDKVLEVTSSGIIMTSAIGNDGPSFGTMNNPADQNDVIGVGGIDYNDRIAPFSSRGMTTWEIPLGYGRAKPDVMTYGSSVSGSAIKGGCRTLSGTSVSAPVVAGAVCLLASSIPKESRATIMNPGSMKQALVEGAKRLPDLSMFEQGQGALSLKDSYTVLKDYVPRASLVPSRLNMTECPYAWPYCTQPLYANAMPVIFNATILNGMHVTGKVVDGPHWIPQNDAGQKLDVRFEYSEILWPWSGYLAIYLRVLPDAVNFSGIAEGRIEATIESPPVSGSIDLRRSQIVMHLTVEIIPKPPRSKRILWDQFRSIRYPPAYIPRDDLSVNSDILDWHGDHPHTNFHDFFNALRKNGYFLEILASPATCFDGIEYGALMIVDPEEEFYPEEIAKIHKDVQDKGMGLVIFADWYDLDVIPKMRFYDDNTRGWWDAVTGGSNIPALNDLIGGFGASFAGGAHDLSVSVGDRYSFRMSSGSAIGSMPKGSYILEVQGTVTKRGKKLPVTVPVLGVSDIGAGRLVLYGDSNCLDSTRRKADCDSFAIEMLRYASKDGEEPNKILESLTRVEDTYGSLDSIPKRPLHVNYGNVSFVLQNQLKCHPNSPLEYQNLSYKKPSPLPQPTATGDKSISPNNKITEPQKNEMDNQQQGGDDIQQPLQNQQVEGGAEQHNFEIPDAKATSEVENFGGFNGSEIREVTDSQPNSMEDYQLRHFQIDWSKALSSSLFYSFFVAVLIAVLALIRRKNKRSKRTSSLPK